MAGKESVEEELARLQKQLADLEAREFGSGPVDGPDAEPVEELGSESKQVNRLKEGLDELFDLLEEEAKKRPAVSALMVFSLGVMLGRLLK
ncbi:hypothetical protein [Pelagicoccus mobilis]|uniref:Uncharacterized protein n=1 Tax=Pelagicoccus mobilis TaxID=415221 RepID=A0A934RWQ5_9BACT|nr:hypothetical protein [Pelagicoccus mobilis]MBK1879145.1 hypothetical protein [Pelagicoccus mobilis]